MDLSVSASTSDWVESQLAFTNMNIVAEQVKGTRHQLDNEGNHVRDMLQVGKSLKNQLYAQGRGNSPDCQNIQALLETLARYEGMLAATVPLVNIKADQIQKIAQQFSLPCALREFNFSDSALADSAKANFADIKQYMLLLEGDIAKQAAAAAGYINFVRNDFELPHNCRGE